MTRSNVRNLRGECTTDNFVKAENVLKSNITIGGKKKFKRFQLFEKFDYLIIFFFCLQNC